MKHIYIIKYQVEGHDIDVAWMKLAKDLGEFKPGELDDEARKLVAEWEACEPYEVDVLQVYKYVDPDELKRLASIK